MLSDLRICREAAFFDARNRTVKALAPCVEPGRITLAGRPEDVIFAEEHWCHDRPQ